MLRAEDNKKIAIVTGASDGVGYYVALNLAKEGYHVIMACRNVPKAEEKKAEILRELSEQVHSSDHPEITVEHLEMANLKSVEDFAKRIQKNYKHLSLLVNNAGLVNQIFKKTENGFEETTQVNYLSPFLLTKLLFPLLIADGNARILQVGSFSHYMADHPGDLLFESRDNYHGESYSAETAYANSKLAAMTFCFELAEKIHTANLPITCLCVTPGAAQTKMVSDVKDNFLIKLNKWITMSFGHSAEEGAKSYMYAALNPTVKPGEYYGPACLFGLFGAPAKTATSAAARNHELASSLWKQTEELLGISFDVNEFDPSSNFTLG